MGKKVLYHSSPEGITTPVYGKVKRYNDYGYGVIAPNIWAGPLACAVYKDNETVLKME